MRPGPSGLRLAALSRRLAVQASGQAISMLPAAASTAHACDVDALFLFGCLLQLITAAASVLPIVAAASR